MSMVRTGVPREAVGSIQKWFNECIAVFNFVFICLGEDA